MIEDAVPSPEAGGRGSPADLLERTPEEEVAAALGRGRRPVLVALGLRPDGNKEVIDFRPAASKSAYEWEACLTDLYRVDGGSGLLAALPLVFLGIGSALLGAS